MEIMNVIVPIAMPFVRALLGWAQKATEDEKIEPWEWKKLIETVIRVGTYSILGFVGFAAIGVENAPIIASVCAFMADKVFSSLKKLRA